MESLEKLSGSIGVEAEWGMTARSRFGGESQISLEKGEVHPCLCFLVRLTDRPELSIFCTLSATPRFFPTRHDSYFSRRNHLLPESIKLVGGSSTHSLEALRNSELTQVRCRCVSSPSSSR